MLVFLLMLACANEHGLEVITEPPAEPEEVAPVPFQASIAESWTQEAEVPDLDVILLLDRSCSMTDDTDRVAAAIRFLLMDLDLRLGAGSQWSLVLATPSPERPGAMEHWDRTEGALDVGTLEEIDRGIAALPRFGEEAGLSAAWHMPGLVPVDIAPSDLFVIISDEDDQSYPPPGYGAPPHGFWYPDEFAGWVTSQPATDVLFVVPDSPGCAWQVGQRYIAAADAGAGSVVDFCTDWGTALADRSWVTALRDSWELAHDPIPGTLWVWVDGARTEAYTLEGRVLVFDESPPVGSLVEVVYRFWAV